MFVAYRPSKARLGIRANSSCLEFAERLRLSFSAEFNERFWLSAPFSANFLFLRSFFFSQLPSTCKCCFEKKKNAVRIWCVWRGVAVAVGKAMGRIMRRSSRQGLVPAGERLYWAITASARQRWIVLLFWRRCSEGGFFTMNSYWFFWSYY